MEEKKLLDRLDLMLILILYTSLAIFSIYYHHYIIGADGISYISIADKYLMGDWSNAINGYWSPLYSWLMIPIMSFYYNPYDRIYIPRIVSLIIGFFVIISLSRLSSSFKLDISTERVLLLTSIPMILFYSIFYDTPDVVVLFLLLCYFSLIFNENYPNKWIYGAMCGFFGGMAFLGKTYNFLFFIVHFIFFNYLYYSKDYRFYKKNIKRNLIVGMVVFLTISGLWIGTISSEYDKLTIGTATEYNHAITGPEYPDHPVYFVGLIKPPNPSATSTWEEPSLVKLDDWSPFESKEYFEFQLRLIQDNIIRSIIIVEYYSILSLVIIIISLYLYFESKMKQSFNNRLNYIILTLFIYSSGYLLIHIQDRYLWPIIILLMFCGFYLVSNLHDNEIISLKLKKIFLIILMFSFIFSPAYELFIYPNSDNNDYKLSKTLEMDYNIRGKIASNKNWGNTLAISYFLKSQYYGLPLNTDNYTEMEKELNIHNINYYFVWDNSTNLKLKNYREITKGEISGLKIYMRIE